MTVSEQARRLVKEASILAYEANIAFDELMHIVGCELIIETLRKCQGNQCAAARQLHIHRNTLSRWLISARESGMEIPRLRGKEHLRTNRKGVGKIEYRGGHWLGQSAG